MREPTHLESAHIDSFNEILNSESITVEHEEFRELGEVVDATPGVFSLLPEWKDVILGAELHRKTPRFNGLGCHWNTNEELPSFGGEFWITDVYVSLLQDPPDLAWEGSPDEERRLFEEFRVIDSTPSAATGQMTAIRVQPNVDPLEIWYFDMNLNTVEGWDRQYVRMNLTYPEYLNALLLTKGTFGWQYLYADVSLRSEGFEGVVYALESMIEVFPDVFPGQDYASLADRLQERL
ncbi:hypothetical protein [Streptomyces sp. NPDC050704]|uniref:hypothetical protein n=1 Tax=Streptomyces sp. NPDC050704 TaxID=3157219 RepID=UPI003426D9CC